jgi:hypothetical protein
VGQFFALTSNACALAMSWNSILNSGEIWGIPSVTDRIKPPVELMTNRRPLNELVGEHPDISGSMSTTAGSRSDDTLRVGAIIVMNPIFGEG